MSEPKKKSNGLLNAALVVSIMAIFTYVPLFARDSHAQGDYIAALAFSIIAVSFFAAHFYRK